MRILPLVLASIVLSAAGAHAQADSPATESEAHIVQEVLGATSADPVTPDEAFDIIEDFSLSGRESGLLGAFSLGAQGNLALLRQEGSDNEALLDQTGNNNLAVLLQLGSNNVTHALQNGTGNVLGVRFLGDNNQLGTALEPGVKQYGNDNVYLLDVVDSGHDIASTVQNGNANQVVQIGDVPRPFGVQQYGNGMQMIIRHNGAQ